MATYKYVAMDINSKKQSGKLEAETYDDLLKTLSNNKLYLLSAKPVIREKLTKRMKNKDCSELCRQLGTMLNSGISLVMAMNIVTKREPNKKLQAIYKNIYVKLQQGFPMSNALGSQGNTFSPLMINMVRAAESSGNLDKTFLKLSDQFERENKLSQKVRSAMFYPMILFAVTIIVVILIFTVIMPSFFNVFNGYSLPAITKFMFALSKFMTRSWEWIIIIILCIIAIVSYGLRIPRWRYRWDKIKTQIPRVKNLISIIYTARFARSLSSLYSSGVSMINCLSLARKTVNNTYIDSQFDGVIKDVRDGTNLSTAITQVKGFDPKLSSSIYIGEEAGRLDDMLDHIAADFDFEAEIATDRLITILQPLMIIILGFIIGAVILSVMLPLYSLYGSIGG